MKITEEQRDWILEQLGIPDGLILPVTDIDSCYKGMEYMKAKVQKVLNKAIEKEFPKFEVGDIFVDVDERDDNMISISFTNTPSSDAYWSLTKQGFKQFTEGCNKIVEYLNAKNE